MVDDVASSVVGDTPFPGGLPEGFGEGSVVEPEGGLTNLINGIKDGVKGIYGIASEGFNFIANNPLCVLMVSLAFAGAGLGLVARAFKTARR